MMRVHIISAIVSGTMVMYLIGYHESGNMFFVWLWMRVQGSCSVPLQTWEDLEDRTSTGYNVQISSLKGQNCSKLSCDKAAVQPGSCRNTDRGITYCGKTFIGLHVTPT